MAKNKKLNRRSRRHLKNTRRTRRQRGAGGCFGWGCSSAANTGVNESAIVANPIAPVASANPYNTLIQELENLSLQQLEIQNLDIEQMNLESKQLDGSINVQEQERFNALQSGEKSRENQLRQLNARVKEISAQIQRLTEILARGIH
jgi:ABC-type phosphate transport system auxiliary subunit